MKRVLGFLAAVGVVMMAYMVFFWSPVEVNMGFVQKIMYIHVPSIWTAYLAFLIAFVTSILYLWKRKESFDIIALSAVEIGVIFCGFALVTGAIWGQPTWNTYWEWDARLTATLILLLIYCGYLLLRKMSTYSEQQARLAAVVAIIGSLDIPLIHLSVTWWRTLHQPSTVLSANKNAIATPLLVTLMFSLAVFTLIFGFLLLNRIDLENKNRFFQREVVNES